jgi:hypothetical protein
MMLVLPLWCFYLRHFLLGSHLLGSQRGGLRLVPRGDTVCGVIGEPTSGRSSVTPGDPAELVLAFLLEYPMGGPGERRDPLVLSVRVLHGYPVGQASFGD